MQVLSRWKLWSELAEATGAKAVSATIAPVTARDGLIEATDQQSAEQRSRVIVPQDLGSEAQRLGLPVRRVALDGGVRQTEAAGGRLRRRGDEDRER
jgi:hypothetical protein